MEETQTPSESVQGAPPAESQEAPGKPKKKRSRPLELLETIVVAFVLAIFIRATLAEARYIPSGSMIPNLLIGDRLIVEKVSYYFSSPQRGDIMVFYPPDPYHSPRNTGEKVLRWLGFTRESAYIKRVIGLPGETVAVKNGKVLINGKPLDEPYIQTPALDDSEPVKIPSDNYFMMGDNRNNSRDSRFWGTLPKENIIGKTFIRFWPMQRLGMP